MAKSKGARIVIHLECSTCRTENLDNKRKAGVFRYTTNKNRKNTPSKLEIKKFCPNCNKHVQFKEIK